MQNSSVSCSFLSEYSFGGEKVIKVPEIVVTKLNNHMFERVL